MGEVRKKENKRGRPPKIINTMDASLTIKLPVELRDAANGKSDATGIPVAFVVRKALEAWVNEGGAAK